MNKHLLLIAFAIAFTSDKIESAAKSDAQVQLASRIQVHPEFVYENRIELDPAFTDIRYSAGYWNKYHEMRSKKQTTDDYVNFIRYSLSGQFGPAQALLDADFPDNRLELDELNKKQEVMNILLNLEEKKREKQKAQQKNLAELKAQWDLLF